MILPPDPQGLVTDQEDERLQQPVNPWDSMPLPQQRQPDKLDLSATIAFEKEDTERSTRILRAADEVKLPIDFVERNLEQLEKDIARKGFDPKEYRKRNPMVSEWLEQNPHHFSAAKNDLSFFEQVEHQAMRITARAKTLIGGQMRTASLIAPQIIDETLFPGASKLLGKLVDVEEQQQLRQLGQSYESVMRDFEGAGDEIGAGIPVEDVLDKPLENLIPFIIETGIYTIPDMAASILALPAYVSARTGEMTQERAQADMREPTFGDWMAMLPVATAVSLFERLGAKGVLGISDVAKTWKQVPKEVLRAGAREAGTEFIQETVEYAATRVGTETGANEREAWLAGIGGAIGGGGFGTGVASVTVPIQSYRYQRSMQMQQQYFDALAGNAEMRDKLPAKMREVVDKITADGPLEKFYIPVEAHNEYWQSQGVDPREAASQVFGSADPYDAAESTGGLIEVSAGQYAAFVAGTEHHQFYRSNMTADPNFKTQAEFDRDIAELRESQPEERDFEAEQSDFDYVKEQVLGELLQVKPRGQAEPEAELIATTIANLAQRAGVSARELFDVSPVRVRREIPEALRGRQPDNLELLINRMRDGTLPTDDEIYGTSLLSEMRKRGVRDIGGELAARDIDVDQVGRNVIDRASAEWDLGDITEWAFEQGIISENDETQFLQALDAELAGERLRFRDFFNQNLDDIRQYATTLQNYFDEIGIDLDEMSNEEIIRAIEQGAIDRPAEPQEVLEQQTDSAAFRNWFGDSQVVDENGEPLVVYHATTGDFDQFQENRKGVYFVSPSAEWVSKFLTDESGGVAEQANVMPVYVSASNIFDYENNAHVDQLSAALSLGKTGEENIKTGAWGRLEDLSTLNAIRELGFDGLYVSEDGVKNIAVFDPSQIKSAIGNRGTFDPESASILEQASQNSEVDFDALNESAVGEARIDGQAKSEMTEFLYRDNAAFVSDGEFASDAYRSAIIEADEGGISEGSWESIFNGNWAASNAVYLNNEDKNQLVESLRGMVVYHGTVAEFDGDPGLLSKGDTLFVAKSIDTASYYAGESGEVKQLKIYPKKPFFILSEDSTFDIEGASKVIADLKASGYDSIVPVDGSDIVILSPNALVDDVALEQFAGEGAYNANIEALNKAKQMRDNGTSNEVIRRETGWHYGVDGRWRYEISDDQASWVTNDVKQDDVKKEIRDQVQYEQVQDGLIRASIGSGADYVGAFGRTEDDALTNLSFFVTKQRGGFSYNDAKIGELYHLEDVLNHDKLFEAYPQLRRYYVTFVSPALVEYNGSYGDREITLAKLARSDDAMSTLLHEVQHAIQEIEDFARGGAPAQEFTDSVRSTIESAAEQTRLEVEWWNYKNAPTIEEIERNAEIARNALKWQSVNRLMEYANREAPSGVFRLIKNEVQWIYHGEMRGTESAREIERMFYGIPKRGAKRNEAIRDIAYKAAQAIRDTIPADQIEMFRDDQRQLNSMVKALEREATKARKAIQPRQELERKQRAAQHLAEKSIHKTPFQIYRALAGEIEARTTQARQNLTEEQRRVRSPQMDMDVPVDEAIVIVGGQEFLVPDIAMSAQQEGRRAPRGTIQFPTRTGLGREFLITLKEGANLSTVLHESAHYFLEIMLDLSELPTASDSLKQDTQALFDWMGIKDRSELKPHHHEMFAEGFEEYLREGKAPSERLRGIFATFKAWLLSVYRSITSGRQIGITGTEINDDVRAIFDRMLATEEEIALAQQSVGQRLYDSFEASGMEAQEWESYIQSLEDERLAAEEQVTSKVMRQLEREKAKWWKEERAKQRQRIANEVAQERVYRLILAAQKRLTPDGQPLPDGMRPFKFSRKELVELYGEGFLKQLPRPYIYAADGGVSVQTMVSVFGFQDADAMFAEITAAQPYNERVDQLTDDFMRQEYGDYLMDGEIPEMAVNAVHGDKRKDVIEIELKSLGKRTGRRVTPRQAVRDQAQMMIAQRRARDIRPSVYLSATRKAANAAFRAATAGDLETALREKQKQLLNEELHRAAINAQELEQKLLNKAQQLQKKSAQERIGKAGGDYLEQINNILEQYEFRRVSNRQLQRRDSLRAWVQEKEREGEFGGEELDVPDFLLDNAQVVNYRDLTIENMQGLMDMILQLEHFARLKNKLLSSKTKREREEAQESLVNAALANMKRKKKAPLTKAGMDIRERIGSIARQFDASLLKMEQVIQWLDDGDVNGAWHELLFNPVVEAQALEQEYTEKVTKKLSEAVFNMPKEIRKKMMDSVGDANGRKVIRRDVLGMALNAGNESNLNKMLKGNSLTMGELNAYLDILTKEEWDFVQSVWDMLEDLWPDIAALEKEIKGVEPPRVESRQVQTKYGTYRGGYYPVMYDTSRTEAGEKQLASMLDGMLEPGYVRATTPKGHTKQRVEGYSAPFDFNIDRLPLHVAGVIKDLTHRRWLIDANWIVNNQEVMGAIEDVMGNEYRAFFKDWVKNVANDRNADMIQTLGPWNKLVAQLRLNMMIATMGFKATTLISQFAGIGPAIEVIGGKDGDGRKWLIRSYARIIANPRKAYELYESIKERSPEMRYRLQNKDRDMRDKLRALSGKDTLLSNIQEAALQGIGYFDLMVTVPTWQAAYDKAISQGKSEETAVREGDRAVRLSQGAGGAKDLASVASRSNQFMRLITMYYTPFSALQNRLRDIGHSFGGIKDTPQALFRTMWLVIVPAVIGEILVGRGPDEDEEPDEWFIKTVLGYSVLGIPGARDVMNATVTDFGYTFTPLSTVGKKTALVFKGIEEVATGDKPKDEAIAKLAKDTLSASGYWLGLPTSQLEITGGYLYDLSTGEDDTEDFVPKMLYRREQD